jgi:uncharacterized protein (DUF427 family)
VIRASSGRRIVGMQAAPRRIEPGPGQESVWDYPRPPAVVPSDRHVRIDLAGEVVAESRRALRVLETAGAPVWYLPREDVRMDLLRPAPGHRTICEWKGVATYFDLVVGAVRSPLAAWTYEGPRPGYEAIAGHVAFYPARVDAALVDGERARPQPGGFYGGWVTSDVAGPFKGEAGTEGW